MARFIIVVSHRHGTSFCYSLASIDMINALTKSNRRWKGVYQITCQDHNSQWREIKAATQAGTRIQDLRQGWWRHAVYWLDPHWLFTRVTCQGQAVLDHFSAYAHQWYIKKMSRDLPTDNIMKAFSQLVLCFGISSFCHVDKNKK